MMLLMFFMYFLFLTKETDTKGATPHSNDIISFSAQKNGPSKAKNQVQVEKLLLD